MNNTKYDKAMMETAKIWAKESYCKRSQVGAVLSKDGRILATGYNGTISGQKNICEKWSWRCPKCNEDVTNIIEKEDVFEENCPKCGEKVKIYSRTGFSEILAKFQTDEKETSEFTLHAEQNVISFCAKNGIPTEGTVLYVTLSPCKTCAKLIAQSGIKEVVYDEEYRDASGIDFLKKVGVKIRKFKNKESKWKKYF